MNKLTRTVLAFTAMLTSSSLYGETVNEDWVSFDAGNMVVNIDKTGYGIGVHKSEDGSLLVELVDKNEDGVIDLLRYLVLTKSGEKKYQVEDFEMDGVLDQRVVFEEGKLKHIEIPYKGNWKKTHHENGKHYIIVSGKTIPLEYEAGILRVFAHNKAN